MICDWLSNRVDIVLKKQCAAIVKLFNKDICICCLYCNSLNDSKTVQVLHQHSWTRSQQHASARESEVKDKITEAFDEVMSWLIKLLTFWWVQGGVSVKYFSAMRSSLSTLTPWSQEECSFKIFMAKPLQLIFFIKHIYYINYSQFMYTFRFSVLTTHVPLSGGNILLMYVLACVFTGT